jgi:tetratricopeptide (TPR) repeat protein
MELVEGRPLGQQVPAEGMPTELVLRYGAQMADALAHAHERGVIHRDLKTSNVMITPDGRAKVLDFGLARRVASEEVDEATRSQVAPAPGGVAGTLHYLAPETLRGAAADARSDVWSLGVVLYQMTAGRLPFDGKSGYEVSSAILRDPLPALPSRVPAGLRAVIQRCLAREPGQRYQRAGEVRAALEAIGSSDAAVDAIAVTGPPAAPMASRPWRSRKLVWVALAAVAIVALAFWKGPFLISIGRTEMGPAGERTSTGARASANTEANESFERGMHFLTRQVDMPRARQLLERAIELDPQFAEARGWYGFSMLLEIDVGYSNDPVWLYRAEEQIRRTLEIDPLNGHAHTTLAALHFYRGDKDLAKEELDRALEINPEDFDVTVWLAGNYHYLNGEYETAEGILLPALERNPMITPIRWNLAEVYRDQGKNEAAIREYQKIREQDPQNPFLAGLVRAHLYAGDLPAAHQAMEYAKPSDHRNYWYRALKAILLAREGRRTAALQEMDDQVLKYAALNPWVTSMAAEFYALLGESEKAIEWLDQAVRNGDERAEWFQRNPLLASIRNHPRFQQVLDSIRFQRQRRADKAGTGPGP